MGNTIPVNCEVCSLEYGETAIFKVHHHGILGGHSICINCYTNKKYLDNFKNELRNCDRIKQCNNCGYKNKNIKSKKLLKIYWVGKYGDKILCERCVFDKDYRTKNHR